MSIKCIERIARKTVERVSARSQKNFLRDTEVVYNWYKLRGVIFEEIALLIQNAENKVVMNSF